MLNINFDRLFEGRWGRLVSVLLIITTHGIQLGLWAYLMKSGIMEPDWLHWRVYVLTILAISGICLVGDDGGLGGWFP